MQDAVFAAMGGKYYARSKVEVSTVLYVFKKIGCIPEPSKNLHSVPKRSVGVFDS